MRLMEELSMAQIRAIKVKESLTLKQEKKTKKKKKKKKNRI